MPHDPERWSQIERLFAEAAALDPVSRSALLDRRCAGDAELRREVESLIRHDAGSAERLALPIREVVGAATAAAEAPPVRERIGAYSVVRELGRGGMGTVYLATRADDEYQKQVAIKLVPGVPDSPELLRRFRSERQILATLEHPHIARLLDGGALEDGLPYLVMEYVEGEAIDEYCDHNLLSIRSRLELFRKVCSAVQHAHRNLVVHRDIKPGNILVTADGEPKLLDFGISKLLDASTASSPGVVTGTAVRLMTPEYASPEQVRGEPVTTSSDVYSLGVLLYELLSGRRPYRVTSKHLGEISQAICEQVPERPSAAVTREPLACDPGGAGATTERISRVRGSRNELLRRQLAGDLDDIVMMALRKEPERRYASVDQLAEDIRRHLEELPVQACRDTWRYRAGKFARRHRIGLASATVIVMLAVGLVVAMVVQAGRIAKERDRAEQVAVFLAELFRESDPGEARGATLTARELLDRGARRIESELAGEPEIRADLEDLIGDIYQNLGFHDEARPLLERALVARRGLYGDRHPKVADTLRKLGRTHMFRQEWESAEACFREVLDIRRAQSRRDNLDLAEALNNVAMVRVEREDFDGGFALFEESLAMRRRLHGSENVEVATLLHNMAEVERRRKNFDQAAALYREALSLNRRFRGDDHPSVAVGLSALGLTLRDHGQLDEAEALLRQSLALGIRLWGKDSGNIAPALSNLAGTLQRKGDSANAASLYRDLLDNDRRHLGPDSPYVAEDMHALAMVLADLGQRAEAERLLREALDVRLRVLGPDATEVASTREALRKLTAED